MPHIVAPYKHGCLQPTDCICAHQVVNQNCLGLMIGSHIHIRLPQSCPSIFKHFRRQHLLFFRWGGIGLTYTRHRTNKYLHPNLLGLGSIPRMRMCKSSGTGHSQFMMIISHIVCILNLKPTSPFQSQIQQQATQRHASDHQRITIFPI
jgi:hypothetical protein